MAWLGVWAPRVRTGPPAPAQLEVVCAHSDGRRAGRCCYLPVTWQTDVRHREEEGRRNCTPRLERANRRGGGYVATYSLS